MPLINKIQNMNNPDQISTQVKVLLSLIFVLRSIACVFSFPALAILISHTTPDWNYVALVSSTSQSLAAFARALAPLICGYVLSVSLHARKPYVWFTLLAVSIVGNVLSLFLHDKGPLPPIVNDKARNVAANSRRERDEETYYDKTEDDDAIRLESLK